MGQKIHPFGFRLGSFYNWRSRWFVEGKEYKDFLYEDILIRNILREKLKLAGVSDIEIERLPKILNVIIYVARPGIVIGRGGTGLEEVKKIILKAIGEARGRIPNDQKIEIKVNEIKNPDLSAYLVASRIASDLERRLPHRRVVTKAMERVMEQGALGVKVVLSGRIGGTEIARSEKFQIGSVPTQTLREDIDFAKVPALLKKGYVGVKVYIHRKKEEV